ncbi:MAG: tyrosine-type recombinase/integrase, partial [Salinibacter sp.]
MNYDHAAAFIRSLTSAETRRAYRYDLECFLTFLERTADAQGPVEASADTIEDYLRALKRKSLAASTKRRRTAALRQFYDWLRETGAVSLNPVPGTVSFGSDTGGNEPSGRTVDRDALSRLLTEIDRGTAQGQRDYTLILVIVYGALRRTEVASL